METELRVYVGAYTSDFGAVKGKARGIALYQIEPATGAMAKLSEVAAENPSFLAIHPAGRFLFATNEEAHASSAPDNAISAFEIAADGGLTLLNQRPSRGGAPCFVCVTPDGRFALTANYTGGNFVLYPIGVDGRLAGASDNAQHSSSASGKVPHAHSINVAPNGRSAVGCDLGLDQVFVYEIDLIQGKLLQRAEIDLARGSGPRHLALHPNRSIVYVINELNATLTVFDWHDAIGQLREIQTISTVPADYTGQAWCADVHVHPSGKFVYGSNRVHDSIVIYGVDQSSGQLALLGHESVRGKTPRNFTLTPAGDLLLVANQDSDTVVVFRVDANTGQLSYLATNDVPTPVCLKFA